MPSPRTDLAAVATPDGRIFAIGGAVYAAGRYSPTVTVQIYDIATDTWSSGPPLPSPRSELAATMGADGRIYAFGGYDVGLAPRGVLARSGQPRRPAGRAAADALAARAAAAVTGPDGTMYVIGGWDGCATCARRGLQPDGRGWSCTVPLSHGPSWAPAIASTWGMAAFGGANGRPCSAATSPCAGAASRSTTTPPVTTTPPTGHVPTGQVPLTNVPFVVSCGDSTRHRHPRPDRFWSRTDGRGVVHAVAMPLADHQVAAASPSTPVPAAAVPDDAARLPRQHRLRRRKGRGSRRTPRRRPAPATPAAGRPATPRPRAAATRATPATPRRPRRSASPAVRSRCSRRRAPDAAPRGSASTGIT